MTYRSTIILSRLVSSWIWRAMFSGRAERCVIESPRGRNRARTERDMKAQTVDVKASTGRILCCTIFRPGGRKLLAKGHVISDEDVRVLESEGMAQIWV